MEHLTSLDSGGRTNTAQAYSTLHGVDSESRIAWVSKAVCRLVDPDELFVRGAAQRKAAAVICRHCPVRLECGAEALDNRVEFGVWGGMTERQRRALLKQYPEVVSWAEFFAVQRKQQRNPKDGLKRLDEGMREGPLAGRPIDEPQARAG